MRASWSALCLASLLLTAVSPGRAEPVVVTARARQHPAALAELNAMLWQPLRAAFAAGDINAYRDCFAGEAIIASGNMTSLNPFGVHALGVARRFMLRREREGYDLVPRFTERAVFAGLASERGIVEETSWHPAGRWEKTHHEFHAFSRKVDGVWRIEVWYQKTLQGADPIRAFGDAAAMEDLARF
jgi:hypothetical protein